MYRLNNQPGQIKALIKQELATRSMAQRREALHLVDIEIPTPVVNPRYWTLSSYGAVILRQPYAVMIQTLSLLLAALVPLPLILISQQVYLAAVALVLLLMLISMYVAERPYPGPTARIWPKRLRAHWTPTGPQNIDAAIAAASFTETERADLLPILRQAVRHKRVNTALRTEDDRLYSIESDNQPIGYVTSDDADPAIMTIRITTV